MNYILAVQTPAYRISDGKFAIESAFAQHLYDLKGALGPSFSSITILAPHFTDEEYYKKRLFLSVVDCSTSNIDFLPAYVTNTGALSFWTQALPALTTNIAKLLGRSSVLHSGMSFEPRRPLLAIANILAWHASCPTIFIVDIDFRNDPSRYRRFGKQGVTKYVVNRFILNPFRSLQIRMAVHTSKLVLLKGNSLVNDYGKGKPHVKNFYDTVHSLDQVLSGTELEERISWLRASSKSFTICYFGRFSWSKGIDYMIDAVEMANLHGMKGCLRLIGDGEYRTAIADRITRRNLGKIVELLDPIPYGDKLFEALRDVHLVLSTPLVEDTPRAVFDALARAIPVLAFKMPYFEDIAKETSAVRLAEWADAPSLATHMLELNADRNSLASMALAGAGYARINTQAHWMEKRVSWMNEFVIRQEN